MLKKSFYLFSALTIYSCTFCENIENVHFDEKKVTGEFTDIFDFEDDDETRMHKLDFEEAEIEALEEFAPKPVTPSQATIIMRQVGIKALLSYLAMRGYCESMWSSIKDNTTRFKLWVMREQAD